MSEKSFTVTEGRLRAMAKECPDARRMLEKGFPEAFEPENVTDKLRFHHSRGTEGIYVVSCVLTVNGIAFPVARMEFFPTKKGYEIYPRQDINIQDFIEVRSK